MHAFLQVSSSSGAALRMICMWLDTDDCGMPRMSASSQTQSARSSTRRTIRQRVSSASARQNATTVVHDVDCRYEKFRNDRRQFGGVCRGGS